MQAQNPPVPAFLSKLWALVEDPASEDVIAWNWDGQNFCIRDEQRFCREILPRYFKHNNLSSFIRQLNTYGFRKVLSLESGLIKSDSSSAIEFQHPYFKKGKAELLENIKRKVSAVKSDDSSFPHGELHKVLTELQGLKDIQTSMDTKLDHMRRENQALWTEVASLRRKHSQQQKLLAKILQFILSLMRGNIVMGPKRKRPLTIEAPRCPAPKYTSLSIKGKRLRVSRAQQVSLSSQHPDVTAGNLLVIHEGSGSGEGPTEPCSQTTGKSNQCTSQFVTPAIPDSYKDTGQAVLVDVPVPDIQPAASDLTVVPSNAASADGLELDLASSTDDVINSILNENCSSATLDREEIQDFLSCIDASLEELQTMLSKKNLNMSSDIIEELFNPDLSSSDISVTGPPASLSNDMKANRAEGSDDELHKGIPGSDDELHKGKQLMQYTGNPLLPLFDELPASDYGAAAPDSANLLASVEEDVFPSSSSEHCYAAPDSIRDLDPQAEEFESFVPIYVLSPVNKLLEEATQPESL